MSDLCRKGLHVMAGDNIIDRTHYGKGITCRECRRASARNNKRSERSRLAALFGRDDEPDPLAPVPPGHRTAGWVLTDDKGTDVRTFTRLTDFTDTYSKPVGKADDDLPAARVYHGPPDTWRLRRITEPRHIA